MPADKRLQIELANLRVELAEARAEIARLTAELTELRLNPLPARRGSALPGNLTPAKINALVKQASDSGRRLTAVDCDNLSLQIIPGDARRGGYGGSVSWVFRWSERVSVGKNTHRSRAIGLGALANVDIDAAREQALHYRRLLQQHKDPQLERANAIHAEHNARDSFKTFNQVADALFTAKISRLGLKRRRTFDSYLRPVRANIGNMPIQQITRDIVLAADGCDLERIWIEQNKTGVELRGFLQRIFGYAISRGWFEGENPAKWREGLEHVLPSSKQVYKTKHHPSMPYQEVPDFIPQLRAWRYNKTWHLAGREGRPIPAFAVEMLILTGVRTQEVRRARYDEFDRSTMIWHVPGFDEDGERRTKNGEDHDLPITTSVLAILDEMEKVRIDRSPNAFVFPSVRGQGERRGKQPINPLGMQTLSRVLREHLKLDTKFVNHGFRSTLRTWCSTRRKYPERWWDIQVGHTIGDKTRQAYPLEQMMDQRREMMQAWDDYCTKPRPKTKADNVVAISKRRTT